MSENWPKKLLSWHKTLEKWSLAKQTEAKHPQFVIQKWVTFQKLQANPRKKKLKQGNLPSNHALSERTSSARSMREASEAGEKEDEDDFTPTILTARYLLIHDSYNCCYRGEETILLTHQFSSVIACGMPLLLNRYKPRTRSTWVADLDKNGNYCLCFILE